MWVLLRLKLYFIAERLNTIMKIGKIKKTRMCLQNSTSTLPNSNPIHEGKCGGYCMIHVSESLMFRRDTFDER